MISMRQCAALGAAVFLASCAPQTFRGYAGAAFTRIQGEIALQNTGGNLNLAANMNDVKDQLGSGDGDASPYLRFEADWGANRVKASGFSHNSSGTGTLAGDFGDLPAGTAVSTDLDFTNATVSWSYDLMPGSLLRLAPGVEVGYYSLDVTVRAISSTAFENVDTDLIVPMPYMEAEVDLGAVSLAANAGLMAVNLRDANGRYWDAEALLRARPADKIELIAGLRYLLFDAHGAASGRDFDSDFDVFGWFVGGGVKF
jgi:hypothetical protein